MAVGSNLFGQLDVSSWTNIKAVAAGSTHTVGLKEDGTVVAVGDNQYGQLNVSPWTNIKAVAAGAYHTVGLKEDGTVVAVGGNWTGQLNVSSWTNITAVAAGGGYTVGHTVGLKEDGTVVAVGWNGYGQLNVSSWTNIKQPVCGTADAAPPVTTHTISGTAGSNGWYISDITITLTASDSGSGVQEIHYTLDGGAEVVATGGSASVSLTADGSHALSYYAVDNAGNTETAHGVSVNIDKTPPVASLNVTPGILWPPNHKMVDVAVNGSAADATSGMASAVFTVMDEYGLVQPVVSGFNAAIPLDAWREGADTDGRHYTITAVVTDKAGNQSTASTAVLVPHDMRP